MLLYSIKERVRKGSIGLETKKTRSVAVCTLGCRVNLYESEAVSDEFAKRGFEIRPFPEKSDAYVINTCGVTSESERKSRQMIRRAKSANPSAVVAVMGCASQLRPEECARIGADTVLGTGKKMTVVDKVCALLEGGEVERIDRESLEPKEFEKMSAVTQERARAFVKIEDGCDSACAYCCIPKARGRVRSKSPEDVVAEVRSLVANGFSEVVLTGVETAAYGKGTPYGLIDLLETLEGVEGLRRIRMGSLEPQWLKADVVDRLAVLSKPMPHYHLSLQSGCTRTLNRMKRRYTAERALEMIGYMREKIPGVTFGSDFIVGFPGETEEDFCASAAFVEKAGILNCHVFAYSEREGTDAVLLDGKVDEHEKKLRSARFREVCDATKAKVISGFIEREKPVGALFETYKDGYVYGHTDEFIEVRARADEFARPFVTKIKLAKYDKDTQITEGVIQ